MEALKSLNPYRKNYRKVSQFNFGFDLESVSVPVLKKIKDFLKDLSVVGEYAQVFPLVCKVCHSNVCPSVDMIPKCLTCKSRMNLELCDECRSNISYKKSFNESYCDKWTEPDSVECWSCHMLHGLCDINDCIHSYAGERVPEYESDECKSVADEFNEFECLHFSDWDDNDNYERIYNSESENLRKAYKQMEHL